MFLSFHCVQELVSGSTTNIILKGLDAFTLYKVSVVPIYENEIEGIRQSENGKTSKFGCPFT